jgi:UPF0755 protein
LFVPFIQGSVLFKKFIAIVLLVSLGIAGYGYFWAHHPILGANDAPVDFAVRPGSGLRSAAEQIEDSGVPMNGTLFAILARLTGKGSKLKAGNYSLKPGTTPLGLIEQMMRGELAQESIVIIEGWTFRQMRQALNAHPALRHDTVNLSDTELMAKISNDYKVPEGLFFPDTYLFAKGSSDLQIFKRAHALMLRRMDDEWARRDPSMPYKSRYEVLTMASIIEKETGQKSEREMIAAVFVNRLKKGMLLQTDPTVIYGMGDKFQGNIRKRDLETDTPYNTYTRPGLPPTPISLPGAAALAAAVNPAKSDVLYFVSRGDGTSQFSTNLNDHNRAVNKYQR